MLATALALSLAAGTADSAAAASAGGLTLADAVALALSRNERAATADHSLEAAEARVDLARAFFIPSLSIDGTLTRRGYETVRDVGGEEVVIQRRDAIDQVATLESTVFNARAFPLYREAKLARDAARLDASEEKRLLAFDAARAFLLTLSLERFHEAAVRRHEFAETSVADARARFDAELVSSNDVTRADLELATAQRQAATTRGDVERAYLELGYLLGTHVSGPLAPPEELLEAAATPLPPEEVLLGHARDSRDDVRARQLQAEALRAFALEPNRRIIPSLDLAAIYETTNEGGLSGRDEDWHVSLNFSWDVFDGGVRRAERHERVAIASIAELDAKARERRVDVEVRSALVGLATAQAAVAQALVAVDAGQRNARESGELYRNGLRNALELADAGVSRFEADVALVRERLGEALAYLDLLAALGTGPLGEVPSR